MASALSLSCRFDVSVFSFSQCIGAPWLVSGFPAEGITTCVAVHLVCLWEGGGSGVSYDAIFKDHAAHCHKR